MYTLGLGQVDRVLRGKHRGREIDVKYVIVIVNHTGGTGGFSIL